jgi:hypothetical protein
LVMMSLDFIGIPIVTNFDRLVNKETPEISNPL